MAKQKEVSEKVTFTITMQEEIRQSLKMIAAKERKSMNELINEVLVDRVRKNIAELEKKISGEI